MTAQNPMSEMLTLGLSDSTISTKSKCLTTFTLRKEVIEHSKFTLAIREIARLHERGIAAGVAEGLLLVAQTGSGKTTVLQYYESRFPRIETTRGTRIPVLRVDTPESPTVKTLAEAILFAMGDPAAAKGTASAKTNRIIHFFKECGVELLFIDEFQHFYDGRRVTESKRVSDWLKNLINKVGIPVILAGLPRSIAVVNANPQLRRRFGAPHYMQPFGFVSQDEQLEFRGVLKVIQSRLPVPCIDLSEANVAQRFFYASHGLLDYVVKIIDDAVSRACPDSGEPLTQQAFEVAFKRTIWLDAPDHLNPFSKGATLRLLNRTLEPFDIWDDITQYTSTQGNQNAVRRVVVGKRTAE
jgi:hypothetical protein